MTADTELDHGSSQSSSPRGGRNRPVFFFDIDNCVRRILLNGKHRCGRLIQRVVVFKNPLVLKGKNIQELMFDLITKYFVHHLALSKDDADMLHTKYYKDYGLAVSGLAKHHKIDPLDFNREVDDVLPLEGIITPDPKLRALLAEFDRSKVKLWLFTNAHVTHGRRVVRLLGVEDMFEGITYCDYAQLPLICKPHEEMYAKAEREAGVTDTRNCFFVDDSYLNCRHAQTRGWTAAHLIETGGLEPESKAARYQIRDLQQLREIFPQFINDRSPQRTVDDCRQTPRQ